jgi:hypothetical protein
MEVITLPCILYFAEAKDGVLGAYHEGPPAQESLTI